MGTLSWRWEYFLWEALTEHSVLVGIQRFMICKNLLYFLGKNTVSLLSILHFPNKNLLDTRHQYLILRTAALRCEPVTLIRHKRTLGPRLLLAPHRAEAETRCLASPLVGPFRKTPQRLGMPVFSLSVICPAGMSNGKRSSLLRVHDSLNESCALSSSHQRRTQAAPHSAPQDTHAARENTPQTAPPSARSSPSPCVGSATAARKSLSAAASSPSGSSTQPAAAVLPGAAPGRRQDTQPWTQLVCEKGRQRRQTRGGAAGHRSLDQKFVHK